MSLPQSDFSFVAEGGLPALAAALTSIGITTEERAGADGFLAGVAIERGAIFYDPSAAISDILHEAGHLATMPAAGRPHASGNIAKAHRVLGMMMEQRTKEVVHDDFIQACLQCSDPEATAWAYAFGTACGFRPEQIISSEQYDGEGEAVRLGLSLGAYVGVNGLRAAGFLDRTRDFPKLRKWTQDAE